MKKLHHIFLLFLLLSACTSKSQYDAMRRGLDSLNERNRSDQPFTAADVQPYVDFFDSHGTSNDQLLAYYLLGRSYHEQGEAPMALKYYQQAIECADTTDADCDFGQLSRVYGQKAELFNMQRSPRLEIIACKHAIYYAWKAKDTITAIIFNELLCLPYHMLNQMDSALYYSQKASALFTEIGRKDLAAATLGLDIDIYLKNKDFTKAKSAMDEYERNSMFFDESGNIEKGREGYYNYKGIYHEGLHQLDSAAYYYRKLLLGQSNINNREAAYKGLMSIYRQLEKWDSVAKYSDLYCQMNDSASFIHSAEEITRMQALYNYNQNEKRIADQEERARNYKQIIVFLAILFVITGYIIYLIIKRQRRQKKEELKKANSEYLTLLISYTKVQQDLSLARRDQIKFREEKEKEIEHLQKELSLYHSPSQIIHEWHIEQAMLNNPIVKELHVLASKAIVPSNQQWKVFREFVEKELPDFMGRIKQKDTSLTYQEILICVLLRLQFSQGEQSALLGVSKQRVNNLKRSINKKLFGEEGAITLNKNILNI